MRIACRRNNAHLFYDRNRKKNLGEDLIKKEYRNNYQLLIKVKGPVLLLALYLLTH